MPFIERLERRFATQLGSWFKGGKELSTGQWQKMALSRAFMRTTADVLVLDEPTASMDAAAEAELFDYFKEHTAGPHLDPDLAPVLHRAPGRPHRRDRARPHQRVRHAPGTAGQNGLYAKLFRLQAEGYK